MGKFKGVKKGSESSIELCFSWKGEMWMPRLSDMPPTPENMMEASVILANVKRDIRNGVFDPVTYFPDYKKSQPYMTESKTYTIKQLLRDWFALGHEVLSLKIDTFNKYETQAENILIPALGNIRVTELKRTDIRRNIIEKRHITQKTLNNYLTPLRSALDRHYEDIGPHAMTAWVPKATKKKSVEDPIDIFTDSDIQHLLKSCHNRPLLRTLISFHYWTGVRISELFGLQWDNVDFKNREVLIKHVWTNKHLHDAPKTRNGYRLVRLTDEAYAALKKQQERTFLQGGFVFLNQHGNPYNENKYRNLVWRGLLRRAGLRYRAPKQLRHTWATHAIGSGENPDWIADQLGHRDWTVTRKIYFRFVKELYPDAGKKLEEARRHGMMDWDKKR